MSGHDTELGQLRAGVSCAVLLSGLVALHAPVAHGEALQVTFPQGWTVRDLPMPVPADAPVSSAAHRVAVLPASEAACWPASAP